ncbi:hypothetical protein ACWGN5_07605 [Streptomyces sp. NPDC055815]
MNTRSPARQARARDRIDRRAALLVLLDRLDRLSPAEGALLREYVLAELTEADQLTRARRGLDRARDRMQYRLDAAEAAMVEAEQDRDEARSWARHGYEIGQRSCTWSDYGVAPAWLTEEQPASVPPVHIGDGANAEDCPACSGTNPPYPFICPGQPQEPTP